MAGNLQVAYSLADFARFSPRPSAVTLGVFDGVHRGHRAIIAELLRCKSMGGIEAAYLITFDPHPVVVTRSRQAPPVLTTIDERLDLLESYPLDGVLVVRFDREVAGTDYRDFIRTYMLEGLQMRALVLGSGCHFGRGRGGNPESARAEGRAGGFEVKVVPPYLIGGAAVSSTSIRNALLGGDLDLANQYLGHPYAIAGEVVKGEGAGASIGFPTANVRVYDPAKLWPGDGVYAVEVKVGGALHGGMMNVGTAPTLKGRERGIEVNIFGFDRSIYGERIVVYCRAYIRGERAFPSVETLATQLERDRETARALLAGGREAREAGDKT